jgi:hypothetical protein
MISGFVVKLKLPLEFAAETDKLLTLKLKEVLANDFRFYNLKLKIYKFQLMRMKKI